jgi:death-on-curing protein
MSAPVFLTVDEAVAIHAHHIRKYGGSFGIRDMNLLASACANAEATFGGEFLHTSIFEMAAAYLYSICRNHPFVDGNKRAALACALAFLSFNKRSIVCGQEELYDLVIGVAEGRVSKAAVAVFLEQHAS